MCVYSTLFLQKNLKTNKDSYPIYTTVYATLINSSQCTCIQVINSFDISGSTWLYRITSLNTVWNSLQVEALIQLIALHVNKCHELLVKKSVNGITLHTLQTQQHGN